MTRFIWNGIPLTIVLWLEVDNLFLIVLLHKDPPGQNLFKGARIKP